MLVSMAKLSLLLLFLAEATVESAGKTCESTVDDTVSFVQLSKMTSKRTKEKAPAPVEFTTVSDDSEVQSLSDQFSHKETFEAAAAKMAAQLVRKTAAGQGNAQLVDQPDITNPEFEVKVDVNVEGNASAGAPGAPGAPAVMPCGPTTVLTTPAPGAPTVKETAYSPYDNITIVVDPQPLPLMIVPTPAPAVYPTPCPTQAPLTGIPVQVAGAVYGQPAIPPVIAGPGLPVMSPFPAVQPPMAGLPPVAPCAPALVQKGSESAPQKPQQQVPSPAPQTAPLHPEQQPQKLAALQQTVAVQQSASQAASQELDASALLASNGNFAAIIQMGVEAIAEEAALSGVKTGVGKGVSKGLQATGFGGTTALQTGATPSTMQSVVGPPVAGANNNVTIYVQPASGAQAAQPAVPYMGAPVVTPAVPYMTAGAAPAYAPALAR